MPLDSIRATTCRHRAACSTEGIMGVLDVPDVSRSLRGPGRADMVRPRYGEYKFPNQAKVLGVPGHGRELAIELS